jgi:hypothetical protein
MSLGSARGWLLALLLCAPEAMAQRISLADFSGAGGGVVRTQLVNRLCGVAECIPASRVTAGGRLDLRRAQQEELSTLITGAVQKKGEKAMVQLSLVSSKGGLKAKRAFGLERNGLLSPGNLEAVIDLIRTAPAPGSAPVPAASRQISSRGAAAGAPEAGLTAADLEPSSAVEIDDGGPSAPEREAPTELAQALDEPATSSARKADRPVFLVVEVGSDLVNRQLTYFNVTRSSPEIPALRGYELPFFALPWVRVELYPLALAKCGTVSGLGFEGSFGFNPLLKSHQTGSDELFATSAMKADAMVRWRLVASESFPLVISPLVGFQLRSFTIEKPATDAAKLVPDFRSMGLKIGIGVEIPIIPKALFVIGQVSALPVFSSGEIASRDYLDQASILGFDVNAGLRFQLAPAFHILATFELLQYQLTVPGTAAAGDRYKALEPAKPAGATDRYMGGGVAARLQL